MNFLIRKGGVAQSIIRTYYGFYEQYFLDGQTIKFLGKHSYYGNPFAQMGFRFSFCMNGQINRSGDFVDLERSRRFNKTLSCPNFVKIPFPGNNPRCVLCLGSTLAENNWNTINIECRLNNQCFRVFLSEYPDNRHRMG